MAEGAELRTILLTGGGVKLAEVTQLLVVTEKPKEAEIQELLESCEIFVVLFHERTSRKLWVYLVNKLVGGI